MKPITMDSLSQLLPAPSLDSPTWPLNRPCPEERELNEADEWLCLMAKAAQQTLQTEKLQRLFAWAAEVAARSDEPFHPVAKRAAAIALVLERAIALAYAHARGVDRAPALQRSHTLNHALAHARNIIAKLKSAPHPEVEAELPTCELSRTFTDQVTQTWFTGQFDPALVELSEAEAQDLNQYLYASEWMVQCFERWVDLSQSAWEAIVGRLIQAAQS